MPGSPGCEPSTPQWPLERVMGLNCSLERVLCMYCVCSVHQGPEIARSRVEHGYRVPWSSSPGRVLRNLPGLGYSLTSILRRMILLRSLPPLYPVSAGHAGEVVWCLERPGWSDPPGFVSCQRARSARDRLLCAYERIYIRGQFGLILAKWASIARLPGHCVIVWLN